MTESTFSKLKTCSEENQVTVEYNGDEYLIKPYSYRDGKAFISTNVESGAVLEDILLDACVEAFIEPDGNRMADSQSFEVVNGLVESLPYAFVEKAGDEMLVASFGENWKELFPQEVEEPEVIEITQEDIDNGRELAEQIATA